MPDSPAPTARPPEQSLSPWLRAGLTLACVSVLAATHLALYYTRTEFPHLEDLASHLRQFMAGTWWTKGPELWETNLKPGGPLYFWLSLPTLFMGQPVVAIHLYYFLLELAAILAWLHCGTRFKLGLGLTWIGGLLLAAYPGSKLVVCENMTIATYLSYPLFITTAAALRTRSGIRCPGERGEAPTWQGAKRAHTRRYGTDEEHRQGGWIDRRSGQVISERVLPLPGWWRMILPGLLAAAMVHCHTATLVAIPAILLAMLLVPGRFLPRLGGLVLGWSVILMTSLPGLSGEGFPGLAGFMARFLQPLDPLDYLFHLATSLKDPVCLLGALLVLRSWKREETRSSSAGRLALIWLAITYVSLTLILTLTGRSEQADPMFGVMLPARAALAGVGGAWLLNQLRRPPLPVSALRLALPAFVLIAALGITAWRGMEAVAGKEVMDGEFARNQLKPCACDVWQKRSISRYAGRYYGSLYAKGLPPLRTNRIELVGPMEESIGPGIYWLQRAQGKLRDKDSAGPPVVVLPSPRLPPDAGPLPGMVDYGSFVLVPDLLLEEVHPRSNAERYRVKLTPGRDKNQLLFVILEGEQQRGTGELPQLSRAGRPLSPRSRCACRDGSSNYAEWLLYDLRQQGGRGAGNLRLSVPPNTSIHMVTAASLAPAAP